MSNHNAADLCQTDLASVKTTFLLPHNPSCLAPCLGMPVFQSRMPESSWRPSNHNFQVKSLDLVLLDIYGPESTLKINTVKKIQRYSVLPKRDAKSRLKNKKPPGKPVAQNLAWLGFYSASRLRMRLSWEMSIGLFHGNT